MDQGIVRVVNGGWIDGLTRDAVTRPDTSTILWETLYKPWNLFTKLDKGDDVTTAESVTLLRDVCSGHDSSDKNCSVVCTSPHDLFASWRTLWQCLSLTSLTLANSTFSTLDQYHGGAGNGTSREQISSALMSFGITNATDFDGRAVLNLTYECATASCRDTSMGKCSIGQLGPGYFQRETIQWIKVYEALAPLCDGLESDINIDIAGPGVLITYITQTAMVVFAWLFFLLLKVNKFINTSTSIFTHLFRKRNPGPNLLTHRVSGLERLERTNLAHATSTFLAELHEAQCFFVVAIEIALINASSRSAIFTGAENWQSLLWNRDSVQFLAGMGAWPIILGQISLRRAELDSMYYLLLSTLALVLAGVAADTAANPDPDRIYKMFQGQNTLEECGGHPSLRTFCVEERESIYWYVFPAGSIYAFLGLLAILWWAKIWTLCNSPALFLQKHKSLSKRQLEAWEWIKWILIKAALFAIHIAEAGALACICFGLAVIRAPLLNLLLRGETGTWSVGQLVAVLIWAPVISKYAHLAILGVEKGFRLRLSKAFEIVKKSDTSKLGARPPCSPIQSYQPNPACCIYRAEPDKLSFVQVISFSLPLEQLDNTMASYNYSTMDTLDWPKIIVIGLVWTPSAYFFNSWVDSQPPGTFVSIACVIFSIISLLAGFHLICFAILVLLSPLFALALLYRLIIELPYLCTGFGPWCLSLFCAQRPPLYASRSEMPQGKDSSSGILHLAPRQVQWLEHPRSPGHVILVTVNKASKPGTSQSKSQQSDITGSGPSFRWAREIIEKCEREHHNCRNHFIRSASQRYLPKRLIDVQSRDKGVVQLLLSGEIQPAENIVEYAALSHCWGATVKSELREDNGETTKTILIETLDPNFRDAVDITYKLGIKYLWIDSLCIMQRTKEWEEESGDMGLVYARAKVVISATASKNSEGGCYKPKDLFPYHCVLGSNWTSSLVVRSSIKYANLVQLFGEKVDRSFLATRGWTFQERFLASRILHFCSGLMMFECNTLTTSECHEEEEYPLNTQFSQNGTMNAPTVPHPGRESPKRLCNRTIIRRAGSSTRHVTRPARDTIRKTCFLWSFMGQDMKEKAEFHLRWYEMVTSYSVHNLTNENDKMMAIAGVAYFIQQSTGFKYAAGLWQETLPFNLLWMVDSGVKRRPYGRSVPSWSWASVDGKISHLLKKIDPTSVSGSSVDLTVEGSSVSDSWEYIKSLVSDLKVQATHMVNGMAHNATLTLSCPLRTLVLRH
ncbi:tol [Fusarium subglutinans]|uniref:Tol n=1 Tax=Gibberella subglutinans TaxID=42677 RepID=A0A8H5KTJ8_GIBSU|nr:tol [Fusarium subglutinans]KAF5580305.1 tol [Fusarium subglutinans]